MSTPGNTSKLGTLHSNVMTAQSNPSLVGTSMHQSAYYGVSALETTRLPVTRWVKLSLNFEFLVPK